MTGCDKITSSKHQKLNLLLRKFDCFASAYSFYAKCYVHISVQGLCRLHLTPKPSSLWTVHSTLFSQIFLWSLNAEKESSKNWPPVQKTEAQGGGGLWLPHPHSYCSSTHWFSHILLHSIVERQWTVYHPHLNSPFSAAVSTLSWLCYSFGTLLLSFNQLLYF